MRIQTVSAPRLLPDGGTVLVMGSGPSLTQADADLCRGRVDAVIAVNDAYKAMPDATCLYAADEHWWKWHDGVKGPHKVGSLKYPAFTGRFKFTMLVHGNAYRAPDVSVIRRGPGTGLSMDPAYLSTGYNGSYQAINMAVHFGATRILLLGVDMQGGHFFGHHPNHTKPPFLQCLKAFATLVDPLKAAGVEILNCTRSTALHCFPQQSLDEALCLPLSVAS